MGYLVDGRMPTEKANGYQSAQNCQAFVECGCDLTLLFPNRRKVQLEGLTETTTVEEFYRLRVTLKKHCLRVLDLIYPMQIQLGFRDELWLTKVGSVLTSYSISISLFFHVLRTRYDLIYLRSAHILTALTPFFSGRIMGKIVFEIHTIPGREGTRKKLVASLGKVGAVIAVTGHLKEQLVGHGVPADRIFVAHDGVDLETFDLDLDRIQARERLGLKEKGRIAGFVGKFHTNGEEKGIPEILSAAQFLLGEFSDLYFYFVGGPLDRVPKYREIIRSLGLPDERFMFLGKQPIGQVPLFLKACDVLLMPHPWSEFYAYHVSPLKLFEYMSSKRPIIASRLPAILEILENERNAFLGEPGDPKSIAANIRRALASPEIASRIAGEAYKDVQEHSWRKRCAGILDFLLSKGMWKQPTAFNRERSFSRNNPP